MYDNSRNERKMQLGVDTVTVALACARLLSGLSDKHRKDIVRLMSDDAQDLGQWSIRYNKSKRRYSSKHHFTVAYGGQEEQTIDDQKQEDVLFQVWANRSALSDKRYRWKSLYTLEFKMTQDGKQTVLQVTVRDDTMIVFAGVASTLSTQTSEISFISPQPTRSATLPTISKEAFDEELDKAVYERLERRRAEKPRDNGDWGLTDDEEESESEGEKLLLLSRSTC
ncbi:hypothetical protein FFLO_02916 [Filobasidium floriforme]|uniref:Uncharacterized protein n=1 Tax=Filobasidium floriforme TaxID=5210 RepID=A0A8K0JNS6_9TREE|nr:uncharacterized protein HD553DRAFT_365782 [Filobasidium floriforme]KAG7558189.1 hypothetical protein FFLO_02916 [Filobasidium floriforme]KAH8077678.1 hypothetical protein HD553DRAFT_365782 [Filobasidium floriforme]